MGGQGLCSVTADQNKILIITRFCGLTCNLMFCSLTCDYYFISISSNTTQAMAAHFDFTFLSRPFLILGCSFFIARVFLAEIVFTAKLLPSQTYPLYGSLLLMLQCPLPMGTATSTDSLYGLSNKKYKI